MSNYFRCDVCGRETYGCNIVNGMKFCAKCYQETFGKDNQQNEIQQLKQQLEEKDKEISDLEKKISLMEEQDMMFHNQLAIQELEKVKIELKNKICMVKNEEHCYSQRFISWYEMCDQINKQIKDLKGEKK